MSIKKLSLKILVGALVLVVLFLLFLGYKNMKANSDFKPYQNLAIELNNGLGGGFKIVEKKNCNLETTNCPSARLTKDKSYTHLEDSANDITTLKNFYTNT